MNKLIRAGALALALTLVAVTAGGCQYFKNIEALSSLGTASIANPVTKERLNDMEAAATLVFSGLNAWKQSCEKGAIPVSCYDDIAAVQVYTRQIPPYLTQLRSFVKSNDQVNATIIWNQVSAIIATVKSQAAQRNVNIGG